MAINDLTKIEFLEFLREVENAMQSMGFERWIRLRNKNPTEIQKIMMFELETRMDYLKRTIKLLRK